MAAKTVFGDKLDSPAHSTNPMKFLLLNPAFVDLKGIWKMDIFKLPGGIILCAGDIQTRPFLTTNDDFKSSEIQMDQTL